MTGTIGWSVADWQAAYRNGLSPREALGELLAACVPTDPAWISLIDTDALAARLRMLEAQLAEADGDAGQLPLYGVPFAVKDNIDVAGMETTCACPAWARMAETDAFVVRRLLAAGAVVIGKTNLDQFATGLVGTRSPYGTVPNVFDARYISGGSSSGSASVVARGLVPFALGTDTAGSGRVPAGFSNIVGLKPSRGLLSTSGLVPACRSLDCISIFALTVEDAGYVLALAAGFDAGDPYSRVAGHPLAWPAKPVLGIPAQPQWHGDTQAEAAFADALKYAEMLGATLRPVDFSLLHETAALLYDGPWVAERYAAIEPLMRTNPEALHPVVGGIIARAADFNAVDAFNSEYRRQALARRAEALLDGLDGLLVPTTPGIHTIAEVEADPVVLNSRLGTYTNFVNLLDMCALALPAGFRADGLPAGVTVIAPAWSEASLHAFGQRWQAVAQTRPGLGWPKAEGADTGLAPLPVDAAGTLVVAVVGAHLSGMPLNGQLTERGARLLEKTFTAGNYRLYALPGTVPPKPGLLRGDTGRAIAVELWAMPVTHFGSFVALIPSPLGIGTLTLADGREVKGFICEPWALAGAEDISEFGGWRAYMTSRA